MDTNTEEEVSKIGKRLKDAEEMLSEIYREGGSLTAKNLKLLEDFENKYKTSENRISKIENNVKLVLEAFNTMTEEAKRRDQSKIIGSVQEELAKLKKDFILLHETLGALAKSKESEELREEMKKLANETEENILILRKEMEGIGKSIEKATSNIKEYTEETKKFVADEISNHDAKIGKIKNVLNEDEIFEFQRDLKISKKEIETLKEVAEKFRKDLEKKERTLREEMQFLKEAPDALSNYMKKISKEAMQSEQSRNESVMKIIDKMQRIAEGNEFAKKEELKEINELIGKKLSEVEAQLVNVNSKIGAAEGLKNEITLKIENRMIELEQTLSRVESSINSFALDGFVTKENLDMLKANLIELFQNKHNESNSEIALHMQKLQNKIDELENRN